MGSNPKMNESVKTEGGQTKFDLLREICMVYEYYNKSWYKNRNSGGVMLTTRSGFVVSNFKINDHE